jgi:RNA polymerase sigma factor (sigma-70 family)
MTNAPGDPLLGSPLRSAGPTDVANLSDGQLLDRFVTRHEEAAFEALLQRHGPLVLGVCRRVLHDVNDADDAFQATFLVLVRKAASIAKRPSVGSWLYGVAYRLAVRAKIQARRRRAHERQAVNRPIADPLDDLLWRDLRPVLDAEVNRLPEKYRAPVVLCYLEGMSYAQAAQVLECSKGAVALRLEQARDRLRERLSRRGLVLCGGMVPTLLTPHRVTVSVPTALGKATVRAAALWAAAGNTAGAIPAAVATLAETTLSALAWAKLKIAVALVLAAGVVLGAAGAVLHQVVGERPAATGSEPAAPKKGRKTLEDRLDGLPRRP